MSTVIDLANIPFIARGMSSLGELEVSMVKGFGGDGEHNNTISLYYSPKDDETDCLKIFWLLNEMTADELVSALYAGFGKTQIEIDDKLVDLKVTTEARGPDVFTVVEPDPEVIGTGRGLVFPRKVATILGEWIEQGNKLAKSEDPKGPAKEE